ncbi:unnamed protein product [Bursaphelenchus okinawaensis]|uniref:non-specific serine/threonine protein kinase n=1 Tax=Bursaphelenchus okinawaensis TaxID=465554 RepID=A0A811KU31_9BILA|nr:unnamed protein product [Bursaphelenchus okinawaensis]CAG9111871.1 unnamed protein product [Bursaphelenchus okinawaensis]
MVVTPKKTPPKARLALTPTKILQERYQRLVDSPKLCTRKEMCMRNSRECEKMTNNARLCRTAPMNMKIGKKGSVMGSTRPRIVSFSDTPPDMSIHYSPNKLDNYLDQVFIKVGALGNGSFGNVYCMMSRDDHKYYAVKCSQNNYRCRRDRVEKQREVMFLERLNHLNVVRFYSAWEENDLLYIQTELCEKSLQAFILDTDGKVPEGTVWNAFVDMLHAVRYIHKLDIVHVDIKPDNIFMTSKKIFKLGDFGMAVDLKNDEGLDRDHEGDAKYLAAEALNMENVTKKMDIFSLGLSIFQLATDLWVPTNGKAWHDIREHRFSDEILEKCPKDLQDILLSMMKLDPDERPEAHEILNLPTVQDKARNRQITTSNLRWDDTTVFSPQLSFEVRDKYFHTPPSQRQFENSSMFTPVRHPASLKRCHKVPSFLQTQVITESSFG